MLGLDESLLEVLCERKRLGERFRSCVKLDLVG